MRLISQRQLSLPIKPISDGVKRDTEKEESGGSASSGGLLRYWWVDTENYITFLLLDKGYYDYDYEKPNARTIAALDAANSDSELSEKLSRMGFAVRQKTDKLQTAERLQADVRLNGPND